MMRRFSILLLFIQLLKSATAQDIHLLQFYASPQNLNPAQTGLFTGDWRLAGNYRTQWSAIPVPYNTFSFSADTKLHKLFPLFTHKVKPGVPSIGLLINNDKAGDSRLTGNQLYVSLGYILKLSKDSSQLISFALQPGICNKNFNTSALTFDSQYDGLAYNPSFSSNERFENASITYFDIGWGTTYRYQKNNRTKYMAGLSAYHLNTPRQSFMYEKKVSLDVKLNTSLSAEIPVTSNVSLLPNVLYQRQGKLHETLWGIFTKYYMSNINDPTTTSIAIGAVFRTKDAMAFAGHVEYKNFNIGVSYDINTSNLAIATEKRGAFEISVIYIFKKSIPFVIKKRVCPVYM